MRIGDTDLGGISGGLYQLLEMIGRAIFLILLGSERSSRIELEYKCVRMAALFCGLPIGVLACVIGLATGNPPTCVAFPAIVLSVLASMGVSEILIYYVQKLRSEDLPPRVPGAAKKTFDQVLAEKCEQLKARGYSPSDARREAWWFAKLQQR